MEHQKLMLMAQGWGLLVAAPLPPPTLCATCWSGRGRLTFSWEELLPVEGREFKVQEPVGGAGVED